MSKYISPSDYKNLVYGKPIDVDGVNGNQCVDLFKHFTKYVWGVVFDCQPSGYAKSLFENRVAKGILNYFDVIANDMMKDGDWAIWGDCPACPKSHVAMFRRDNGNGTGVFLGQNQHSSKTVNEVSIKYAGMLGALRPKIYIEAPTYKTINILTNVPVYISSIDAMNKTNATTKFGKGTYYISAEANGMYNISLTAGNLDGWINPGENVAPVVDQPKPIETKPVEKALTEENIKKMIDKAITDKINEILEAIKGVKKQ